MAVLSSVILVIATCLMRSWMAEAVTCFGMSTCENGGTCDAPDYCLCPRGYYSPRCEECRPIDHCLQVFCNSYYDAQCDQCDGDFGSVFGSAYKKTGDQRRCIKQCSWRADSNACFPGSCTDAQCTCSSGFSGPDCRTMDEAQAPVLSELRATLLMGTTTLELEGVGNDTATLYTGVRNSTDIRIHWKSSYQPTGLPNPSAVDGTGQPVYPYIADVNLGIVSARVTALVHFAQGGTYALGSEDCPAAGSQDNPATTLVICEYTFNIDYSLWTPANGDTLRYEVDTTNGGNMQLYDRDNANTILTRYYLGRTVSASANFTFDLDSPYHCLNVSAGCRTTMLYAGEDVTTEADITITWQGWADDLSGIGEYDLQVRQLSGHHGDEMTETFDSPAVYTGTAVSGHTVTLPHTGVYSIVLSVFDKAGNAQLTRRFVFFDDDPDDVTIQSHAVLRVLSANADTDYVWITNLGPARGSTSVVLDWRNRFANTRHHSQGLLKPIGLYASGDIESDYDQNFGRRGRAAVPNALGVTEFRVLHAIDHSGGQTIVNASSDGSHNWSNESTNTQATFDLTLVDGDSIRFWVEATDIAGHSVKDGVLTHVDSSPPVIDDGDGNLAVPSSADLDNVGIAFKTYDIHSGIRTIEWRIFTNESGTEVELARQTLPPVKIDPATEDCDPTSCMCIPIGDCYAVYYGFNPAVHIGPHASDYFVGLTVTNHARLLATTTIKVTVDSSPPEAGLVHDGIRGSNEVDYQEFNELSAHWDGFSDKESGVAFYRYLFDELCWDDPAMMDLVLDNMTQTTATHASWTAPSPGRYYVTVVAYNTAQESSDPVCSDGVVIDTSPPELTQIAISSARMWPGLAKDAEGRVWFINEHRRKMELFNASSDCSLIATPVNDLSVYPDVTASKARPQHINCQKFQGIEEKIFLPTHKHLTISWTGVDPESSIYDYEIGLSSDPSNPTPDLVTFRSTSGHDHFVMYHPHISQGNVFYLVLKAVNKAQASTVKVVGPVIVDTTPPVFVGRVSVHVEDAYLIAEWGDSGFIDDEDTSLRYQVAIGHGPGGTETFPYQAEDDLKVGPCQLRTSCAAFSLDDVGWRLHGDHEYYVSVRAQNGAGLATVGTSSVYRHIVQLPSVGVVLDVAPPGEAADVTLGVAKDIDVQTDTTSISARWFGFEHPHLAINYEIAVGSEGGASDVSNGFIDVGNATFYRLEGLALTPLTTYYVTVRASSDTGSVNVTSDGVKIIQEGQALEGAVIKDGLGCDQDASKGLSHHSSAADQPCQDDITYQSSTSDISVRWTIPEMLQPYVTNILWAVEQELDTFSGNGASKLDWVPMLDYQDLGMAVQHVEAGVGMNDGALIRSKVQFCHDGVCFRPIASDGFWVLSRPPEVGEVTISDIATVDSSTELSVVFQPFIHEYIQHEDQLALMDHYEWNIAVEGGAVLSDWKLAENLLISGERAHFTASYNGLLDPRLCHRLSVRGFNKAGLSSIASTNLPDCIALSTPHDVIDADHEVHLELNAAWHEPDKDYISSTTSLSAVWPQLRHRAYVWAAIEDIGTTEFGNLDNGLQFPCDHPMQKACGQTDKEFVNVPGLSLQHGSCYRICIHANRVVLQHETWNQTLPSVSSCSDGVVVDTTPPTPGSVWIGGGQHQAFQRSSSELVLHWDSFTDGEEHGLSSHHAGIQYYEYAIGSFRGGSDVTDFTRLGLTDSVIVNSLRLQHGHSYYGTVRAYDFVGLFAEVTSDPIIIDAMPPAVNDSFTLNIGGSFIRSTTSLSASWENVFSDKQSGMAYYEWAVGSHPGHADIMPFTRETSESGTSDPSQPLRLQEGHSYFITVKAVDHVQLIRSKSFGAYVVDASPPLAGHVFDGDPSTNHRDRDFQEDRTAIEASWEGFHDPHSALVGYSWFSGTCPGCSDVVPWQHVGLETSVTAENLNLVPGLTYYVTVTACNAADLCTSVTSDGVTVDDSPPVVGRVYDGGPGGGDISFQSSRLQLRAHWWGFHDPHSGLSHYEWRAGTTPGAEDILPSTRIELSEDALIFLSDSDQMPIGTDIYVTVRAYNRLGSWSQATSSGFRVDSSPPDVVNAPAVDETFGTAVQNTQVLCDLIRISWLFQDPESGIKEQYLSVSTHRNGDINIPPVKVAGSETDHTFTNLTLSDGSRYFITVSACNYNGLCMESKAEPLLVDASPPSQGRFASGTESASNPEPTSPGPELATPTTPSPYHSGWMTWVEDPRTSLGSLALAWLGFADVHSGISHYLVSVGRTYDGSELTSRGPVRIDHRNNDSMSTDKETLQTAVIPLEGSITDLEPPYLYISIWAVNGVGIPSARLHATFEASPTSPIEGALVPLQNCVASTCEGHCGCAQSNRGCSVGSEICNDVSNSNPNSEIEVLDVLDIMFDGVDYGIDVDDTATQYMMAAVWRVNDPKGLDIKWYECSIGDDSSTPSQPAGVFDPAMEKIWFDVGQDNHTVITLNKDQKLTKGVQYYFFVRAWYDANTYAVFRSDGITPDVTPPKVSTASSFKVKDLARSESRKDVDYLTDPNTVFISWEGVFRDDAMSHYQVSLSTYPGGEDIGPFSNCTLPASEFTTGLANLGLHGGQRYYANVRAFNKAGLHTLRSSDGFVVDTERPHPGVVYDGIGLHDVEYQNSSTVISASWHGFVDLESFIDHYEWCVGQTPSPEDDGILPCTDVGLHLSASRTLVVRITEGIRYYSKVSAVDAAGLQSVIVTSDGFVVDTSAPEPLEHIRLGENLLTNPSFEGREGQDPVPHWEVEPGSDVSVEASESKVAQDGRSFLSLHGAVSQTFNTVQGSHYQVVVFASHAVQSHNPLLNQEGRIEAPGLNRVFRLYDRPAHGHSDQSLMSVRWHQHRFYFTASDAASTLKMSSVGHSNGILLDNIQVRLVTTGPSTGNGSVEVHTQFIHSWSSIQAKWHFVDPESPIVDYSWAIGTTRGGTQLQSFTSVGTQTDATNTRLSMKHGSHVHVTVIARNAADLVAVATSGPIIIDFTAPVIEYVIDGGEESDIDFTSNDTDITFSWSASDPESGIEHCEWAVGLEPGLADVIPTSQMPAAVSPVTASLPQASLEGQRLYTTITCHNHAGQSSWKSSDGVTIVTEPPSAVAAFVRVKTVSETQYHTRDRHQSQKDSLKASWEGFADPFGIQFYECHLNGPDAVTSWKFCGSTSETNLDWSGLSLVDDATYTLSVRAINHAGLTSQAIGQSFSVESSWPTVHALSLLRSSWLGNTTVDLAWDGLFSSPSSSLVYEVSLGTIPGGSDIMQWVETMETGMRVSPLAPFTDYHLTLTVINASGLSETVNKIINNE
ncbi:uncharacterized protein LOC119740085 [Patiria miniata]|uniref:Uncharacterized protein n=1 Tax=Patiria miniata TaxID=46514 RepID=A0A914B4L4_PATMI|nr:uncharacterized protein LOC119740085 [Patiria miniata]